jgi:ribonuclease P protein subunit POP4
MDRLVMDELIGLNVKIIKSTRRELIGVRGKIIDETLNTFVVEAGSREKVVPKKLCLFRFDADDGQHEIDGKDLVYRPEDRIKKYWKQFAK